MESLQWGANSLPYLSELLCILSAVLPKLIHVGQGLDLGDQIRKPSSSEQQTSQDDSVKPVCVSVNCSCSAALAQTETSGPHAASEHLTLKRPEHLGGVEAFFKAIQAIAIVRCTKGTLLLLSL